ncbi:MAG: hypothetical protein J6A25_02795 [Lachnospiraceae bacterium]|nr:hypothetical protein [Lachnospiraceae bacterium]
MEIHYNIKPVGVRYLCDNCNGEMKHTDGIVLMSNPPKYKHICSNCGEIEYLEEVYPTIRWIEDLD